MRFSGVELEIGEPNRATIGQNDPNNFSTENNDRMIPISPPREAQGTSKIRLLFHYICSNIYRMSRTG